MYLTLEKKGKQTETKQSMHTFKTHFGIVKHCFLVIFKGKHLTKCELPWTATSVNSDSIFISRRYHQVITLQCRK